MVASLFDSQNVSASTVGVGAAAAATVGVWKQFGASSSYY